ncbi:MAG: IclR family transcriptional regulator [Nitriliruptor sp.]|nr:MAG: IclR family transcriptional regulator [Nitriliruptor sp.]
MSEEEPRRLITTIERAADVLVLFTRSDQADLGVTEIATQLDLSKAVVHRVLTTLAAKGLVTVHEETRRYRLGPVALSLGIAYLDRIDLRDLLQPRLRELSERTNETATMSLRYGWQRMYVDQVTPNREVKMTVVLGRAFPLHAGSSSKAFLAFLTGDEQERYLAQHHLEALTDRTIIDDAQLRAELQLIRERGYAVSFGERQAGAGSVAAPVLDHRGEPAAAVSICGPLERFREGVDLASSLLLETTKELSRQLGYQADGHP